MARGALRGKVCVVAGATRGAGRGIACMLGEAGATVYCTGRSVRGQGATPGRPEVVEDTAAMVTARGGEGIAVRVDHADEAAVRKLFEQVEAERGGLDVLVNSLWGGDPLTEWGVPAWELDMAKGIRLLRNAVETHILTARHAIPRMLPRKRGLLVEMTDGDGFYYRGTLFYDLAKVAVTRLAFDLAEELRPHGIASVALTPGFLRSEAVLDHYRATEERWRDGIAKEPNLAASETPFFVGRAVAALAADPEVARWSGRLLSSWALAKTYGFDDVDGRRPDWGAHFRRRYGDLYRPCDEGFYAYWEGYTALQRAFAGEPAGPG